MVSKVQWWRHQAKGRGSIAGRRPRTENLGSAQLEVVGVAFVDKKWRWGDLTTSFGAFETVLNLQGRADRAGRADDERGRQPYGKCRPPACGIQECAGPLRDLRSAGIRPRWPAASPVREMLCRRDDQINAVLASASAAAVRSPKIATASSSAHRSTPRRTAPAIRASAGLAAIAISAACTYR